MWEYLDGVIVNQDEDARSTMMDMDHWEKIITPMKMDSAVNILLWYKLLDILSGVMDLGQHPNSVIIPQVALSGLPTRVQQVKLWCS